MLVTIVLFIVILGLLVFVHEFGHFVMAKKSGVQVDEFGFGFPPRIFGVKYKGTLYSINWIPLGGFVKIKGVVGEEANPEVYKDSNSFAQKKYWQKALILSAGVFMNLILAIVLLSIGFMIGSPTVIDEQVAASGGRVRNQAVQVSTVHDGYGAAAFDIQPGDKVISIDGQSISSAAFVQDYNAARVGQSVHLVLDRAGQSLAYDIPVSGFEDTGRGVLGLSLLDTGLVSYPWYRSLWLGFVNTFGFLAAIFLALFGLLRSLFTTGSVGADLAGPIGIAALTGQAARLGISYVLQFTAILSINLAIFNILPIPALDGGRLLFVTIERIRGKQNSEKIEGLAHRIGFALLLMLVLIVTFRDIGRYGGAILAFFKGLFT